MLSKKSVLAVMGVVAGSCVFYAYTNFHENKIDWASLPEAAEIHQPRGKSTIEPNSSLQPQKLASKATPAITSSTDVSEKAKLLGLKIKSSIDSVEGKSVTLNRSYQELQSRLRELDDNALAASPSELITDTQRYVKHVLFHYQETSMRIENPSDAMNFVKKITVPSSNSVSPMMVQGRKLCSGEVCNYRYETSLYGQPIFGDSVVLTTVRDRPSKLSGRFLQPDLKEPKKEKI